MANRRKTLRVAMPAWEIGRALSGLGVKIGGLGAVIEELPQELVRAAAAQDLRLSVEVLTPCFAHYDRARLKRVEPPVPVTIEGQTFSFEVFEHRFPDGQKVVYFWDDWQLHWTGEHAVYPDDPQLGLRLYAAVSQAMAGYIRGRRFDTLHLHDYHVGLVPFYLDETTLDRLAVHLTIHNATYQGIVALRGSGPASLERIHLPGEPLYRRYFEFFDNLNLLKAAMLKVHELGGRITTVSGDIHAGWGYAAELRESHEGLRARATHLTGRAPGDVFLPNRHLELFEKLPVAGVTNGLAESNRPEHLRELSSDYLRELQQHRGAGRPLFRHPTVQHEMLGRDHRYDAGRLHVKAELKRLLHLEIFGSEPIWDPILFTTVGRLVEQKNLGLVVDVIERALSYDEGTKFIVLSSKAGGDSEADRREVEFSTLAAVYPDRVFFSGSFDSVLSRLILAGGDFTLLPSRFEPCGLVDYEASLLGTVVVGRATGGLCKVRDRAYLYEWLDISDRVGEAEALFQQMRRAIDIYRRDAPRHAELVRRAMAVEAGWEASATRYVEIYRVGMMVRKWRLDRKRLVQRTVGSLAADCELFLDHFLPGKHPYDDTLDEQLRRALAQRAPQRG